MDRPTVPADERKKAAFSLGEFSTSRGVSVNGTIIITLSKSATNFGGIVTTREWRVVMRLVAAVCLCVCPVWAIIVECLDLQSSFSVRR